MTAQEKVKNILEVIESENTSARIFLITRKEQAGVRARDRMIERYDFFAHKVHARNEVTSRLAGVVKHQLESIACKDDYQLQPYDVISDDLDNTLYTYALNNALAFTDVITNQLLRENCPLISSLSEVEKTLWAYSIEFQCGERLIYTFRKLSKSKVVVSRENSIRGKFDAFFDIDAEELISSNVDSISFDDWIDCLFLDNEFLVLRKKAFESMAVLGQEFQEVANNVADVLEQTGLIEGLDVFRDYVSSHKLAAKQLASIAGKGFHERFDGHEMRDMRDVLRRFEGRDLKTTEDGSKLLIENPQDINDIIRLLNDYYKQGVLTGSYYGTSSGQQITPRSDQ